MTFETLVRTFDSFDAAAHARAALLAGGIDPDLVQTQVIQDEAGPVEGNFLVGNGRASEGGRPQPDMAQPGGPHEPNFLHAVTRGVHMVIVHVSDASMRERAQGILQHLGGVDPQARASLASESR